MLKVGATPMVIHTRLLLKQKEENPTAPIPTTEQIKNFGKYQRRGGGNEPGSFTTGEFRQEISENLYNGDNEHLASLPADSPLFIHMHESSSTDADGNENNHVCAEWFTPSMVNVLRSAIVAMSVYGLCASMDYTWSHIVGGWTMGMLYVRSVIHDSKGESSLRAQVVLSQVRI
jgi:hypothetical protein